MSSEPTQPRSWFGANFFLESQRNLLRSGLTRQNRRDIYGTLVLYMAQTLLLAAITTGGLTWAVHGLGFLSEEDLKENSPADSVSLDERLTITATPQGDTPLTHLAVTTFPSGRGAEFQGYRLCPPARHAIGHRFKKLTRGVGIPLQYSG